MAFITGVLRGGKPAMLWPMFLFIAQAALPAPSSEDVARVQSGAQHVLDRYYAAVRRCGARPPFKPKIEVATSDGIIHYDQPTGHLVLYPWSVVGGEIKTFAVSHAVSRSTEPREIYENIFNGLLVAHELGHWLQGFQPERRTADGRYDNWFAEQNADRLMVAYWRENSSSRRAGERRLHAYAVEDTPNPLPPPAGVPVETFFTTDTMKIVRAGAYGWHQGLQTRRAIAERPAPAFCKLVGEWLPLQP